MPITHPNLHLTRLPGAIPAWSGEIAPGDLQSICQNVQDDGGRLVALWGSDDRAQGAGYALHVALVNEKGLICLSVPLPAELPNYPDISRIFPAANRMQRAAYDLLGIYAQEGHDHRKWLRHGGMAAVFRCARILMRHKAAAMKRTLTPLCKWKAGVRTRYRSGRYMRASSSRDTSVFRWSGKLRCDLRNEWAMSTKALKNDSRV